MQQVADHVSAEPVAPIRKRPALRIMLLMLAACIVASGAAFAGTVGAGQFAGVIHAHPVVTRPAPTSGKGG